MKRRGLIAVLAMMMVMMYVSFSYAEEGALKLTSSYPKDGQTNTSIENVGVKLYFSNSISSAEAKANNQNCVRIVDPDGKAIPIKVLTSDDDTGMILVLGDSTDENFSVQNNAEYRLVIDPAFMDDQGNTLGTETVIRFTTFNQKLNSTINMVMMFIMFGGIMVLTLRQQNQQNKEKQAAKEEKKEAAFNPYREAKKTGQTVEEVIEEEKKRQEKAAKKNRTKAAEPEQVDLKGMRLSDILPNVYYVGRPRPIREGGGTYRSPRAAGSDKNSTKKSGKK